MSPRLVVRRTSSLVRSPPPVMGPHDDLVVVDFVTGVMSNHVVEDFISGDYLSTLDFRFVRPPGPGFFLGDKSGIKPE